MTHQQLQQVVHTDLVLDTKGTNSGKCIKMVQINAKWNWCCRNWPGELQLNCENNSHGIKAAIPPTFVHNLTH